jgi:uncharacterized protein
MRRMFLSVGAPVAVIGSLIASAAVAQEKPDQLVILSGSTGGSWSVYAAGMIPIFESEGISATAIPGGGASNPLRIAEAAADFAFGQTSANYDAQQGQGAFEGRQVSDVMNLALISADHVHVLCRADTGIDSWEGLEGVRFAAPSAGIASWGNFLAGLYVHGLTEDDLNIVTRGDSGHNMTAVRDRQADCTTHTSAWPVGNFAEVAYTVPLNFLGMSDEKVAEVVASNPGMIPGRIPAGVYEGQDEEVNVYMAGSVLMTHPGLPDDTAYWVVRILNERIEDVHNIARGLQPLTPEMMVQAPVWEMHPGAVRYYKEVGLWKD